MLATDEEIIFAVNDIPIVATKVKVKNAISDLDHLAWQFENQYDTAPGNRGKHLVMQKKVTQRVDRIIKDLEALQKIL